MGGVMRLGKALATGVAEEQDHPYEEGSGLSGKPGKSGRPVKAEEPATAAAEMADVADEVPVAR
jgi:hypothetical protein